MKQGLRNWGVILVLLAIGTCLFFRPATAAEPDPRMCSFRAGVATGWAENWRDAGLTKEDAKVVLIKAPTIRGADFDPDTLGATAKAIDIVWDNPKLAPPEVGAKFYAWCITQRTPTEKPGT